MGRAKIDDALDPDVEMLTTAAALVAAEGLLRSKP